jgi:hypothetical protein
VTGQQQSTGGVFHGEDQNKNRPGNITVVERASRLPTKYGDTFHGGRVNHGNQDPAGPNLGHGAQGPKPFTGGGRGNALSGEAAPIPYPGSAQSGHGGGTKVDKIDTGAEATGIPTSHGDNAGVAMGVASGTVMGPSRTTVGTFSTVSGGNVPLNPALIRLRPNPNDNDAGGSGPIVRDPSRAPENQIGDLLKPPGTSGGAGDGRGTTDSSKGGSLHSGIAVESQTTKQGKEMKKGEPAVINWNEALKANRHTDGPRN